MKKRSKVLLFCFITLLSGLYVQAQQRTVLGVVNDHDGNVLSGATVMVKGTSFGTVTNVVGAFAITGPSSPFVLVVSYIGCQTKEVSVDDKNEYLIELDCREPAQKILKGSTIKLLQPQKEKKDEKK